MPTGNVHSRPIEPLWLEGRPGEFGRGGPERVH